MTTGPQSGLVERLRTQLADEPSTREVAMFGGRSFMVNNKMIVSALKTGDLLVRVPRARHEELVAHPGASQAEMGAVRSMGQGWIAVSAQFIGTDADLSWWLGLTLDHNRVTAEDQR